MKKLILGVVLSAAVFSPLLAQADVEISVQLAPPAMPVYEQPPIPGDGYIWTPGFWSWNNDDGDYYWVPGTWVAAPFVGALWTPGYWGYEGGGYGWHGGYWGNHVGYYGGVNYGFGYVGVGYQGGYWDRGSFNYNRSVNNVRNVRINNVYNSTVQYSNNSRVSYNGGRGGVNMQQSKSDEMISHMPHNGRTDPQVQHESDSRGNPQQRNSANHGLPPIAATREPSHFTAPNTVPSRAEPAPQGRNQVPQNYQRQESQQRAPQQQRQQQHDMPQQRAPQQQAPQQQREPQQQQHEPQQQHAPQQQRGPSGSHQESNHGEEHH